MSFSTIQAFTVRTRDAWRRLRGRGPLLAGMGLLALGMVLPSVGARAQTGAGLTPGDRVTVEKRGRDKLRILLEEFAAGPGTARDDARRMHDVVGQDLELSGVFNLMPVGLSLADSIPMASGALARVRGTVEISGDEVTLRGVLQSLPDGGIIVSRDYRTRLESYREAAHRFADDIVLYMTGEPGIARTRIAFILKTDVGKEVHVVDYDGYELRRITNTGSINLSPSWSPDLSKIAYVSYAGGDPDIYVADLREGSLKPLVTGQGVQSAPSWAPDGTRLAYSQTTSGESGIFIVGVDGSGRRRISRGPGIDTSPCWSPDGRRLAFTSDRAGTPQVYVMTSEGADIRRLTFEGKWNDLPAWSRDGERVAYASREDGLFRIYAVDNAGLGRPVKLTFGPGSDENPSWAPDGRHVVFSSVRGGSRGLYVLNTDTGVIRGLVVGKGDCSSPVWSPVPAR